MSDLFLGVQFLVGSGVLREPEGHVGARHDGHFEQRVGVLQQPARERVPRLVVCHDLLLPGRHRVTTLLGTTCRHTFICNGKDGFDEIYRKKCQKYSSISFLLCWFTNCIDYIKNKISTEEIVFVQVENLFIFVTPDSKYVRHKIKHVRYQINEKRNNTYKNLLKKNFKEIKFTFVNFFLILLLFMHYLFIYK